MRNLCRSVVGLFVSGVLIGAWSASPEAQSGQRIAYDLTAMYDAVNPSIVKVHADSGTGSGFLVRGDGLLATNHHVVRNSRYLAVEFPDGRKVTTEIVRLDVRRDLALLKVNRSLVAGLKPLAVLAAEQDSSVRAGIPVVAFGSPLSTTFLMTQGIVSKVEAGILFGDFVIQPGNSGGPLLNMDGLVIGINTFGGGGISGAVRANVLREHLASEHLTAGKLVEPSADPLPTVGRERYPADLLKYKVISEDLDIKSYRLDAGRFTITAVTPVLRGKANVQEDLRQAANRYSRRGKKIKDERYDPVDEPFYDWYRDVSEQMDPVVRFEIEPDFGQTTGSLLGSLLSGVAAGLSNTAAVPTRQTYEFKAEFSDFRLFVDGKLIPPITPGRAIISQSVNSFMFSFVDEAYSGVYTYPPEVFTSGNEWKIEVYDAREPGRAHRTILLDSNSKLIQQLQKDFVGAFR